MSDKVVSVTLRARIEQYLAAMKAAAAAPENVSRQTQQSFQRLGGTMQSAGRAATLGVTVPLIAAGGAAVGMASNFENAFSQMQGLAGVSADEIDGLKESVLGLAGETATGPQELAEALYFLRSSGLDADDAMAALEVSAKASAAGLGDTAVIADAVSSAMNAYAESGLTAAEATDILVATARAGKAEPEELAGALGRVLPVASELGITFEDVGGALAALSLTGNDASTSATLLTNIMSKLLKPSQQGAEALADVGLSTDAIRSSIADQGLLATLEMLKTRLGDAGFVKFMEDAQAVQGALTLVGDESGTVANAFDVVKDHAGATGDAFAAVADDDGFKMKQALVDVQTAMIELGTILLPIAADIASGIADVARWFGNLPKPIQYAVAAVGALAAAAGPLLFVGGSIVRNWTSVTKAFQGASGAMGAAGKALGLVGVAAAVGFAGYQIFTAEQRKTDDVTRNVSAALLGNMSALFLAADAADTAADSIDAVAIAQEALSLALGEGYADLANKFGALNISGTDMFTILAQMDKAPKQAMDNLARSFGFTAEQADALANSNIFSGSFGGSAEALASQIGAPVEQVEAFRTAFIELQGAADNVDLDAIAEQFLNSMVTAQGYDESLVHAAETQAGHSRSVGDAMDVLYAYTQILANTDDETRNNILASEDYQAAMDDIPPSIRAMIDPTYEAADAAAELADVQASSIDTTSNYRDYLDDLNHTLGAYTDALDESLGHGRDWIRAHDNYSSTLLTFGDNIDDASAGLDYNTEAGLANREAIYDAADALIDLTRSNLAAGKSQQQTNEEYQAGREALLDAADAANLNRDDVEDLITQYGLVPDLVTTTVDLANDALAKWRTDRYIEKLDEVPEWLATDIEALIDQGKYDEAWAALRAFETSSWDAWITVHANTYGAAQAIAALGGRGGWGGAHSAAGRYVGSPMISALGEGGNPEAVFPLTNPARIQALWADPRIGGPMTAALNLQPVAQSTAIAAAPSTTGGDTYTFYVTNTGNRPVTRWDLVAAVREARAAS